LRKILPFIVPLSLWLRRFSRGVVGGLGLAQS
jgi:hypothetical protein